MYALYQITAEERYIYTFDVLRCLLLFIQTTNRIIFTFSPTRAFLTQTNTFHLKTCFNSKSTFGKAWKDRN